MKFDWKEITGERLEKTVFVAFRERELLMAVTDNGREFLVEFLSMVTDETEQDVLGRFLGKGEFITLDDPRHFTENDQRLPFSRLYIRKDFEERLLPVVEGSVSPAEAVRRQLDPRDRHPRIVIQQQLDGWEMLAMDWESIKEIEASLKETEQKIAENKEKLWEESIPYDEFHRRITEFIESL